MLWCSLIRALKQGPWVMIHAIRQTGPHSSYQTETNEKQYVLLDFRIYFFHLIKLMKPVLHAKNKNRIFVSLVLLKFALFLFGDFFPYLYNIHIINFNFLLIYFALQVFPAKSRNLDAKDRIEMHFRAKKPCWSCPAWRGREYSRKPENLRGFL